MVIRERSYTAKEFWEIARLPENEGRRLELEDGAIVDMASSSPTNTIIASRIIYYFNAFVLPKNLGHVTSPDGGFKMANGHVRQPDVAFISRARVPIIPDEFEFGPDIAVEIVSPNEDVLKKAKEYLASGTQLVLAVYPLEKTVEALSQIEPRWATYGLNDVITFGEILPDFALAVRDIFP